MHVWIVNYESSNEVCACLASMEDSVVDRIFILNNGTSESDAETVRRLAVSNPRVTVFESAHNLGFGGGHNLIGELTAEGGRDSDIIWLLNPDTLVSPYAIQALQSALKRAAADIISPVILNERDGKTRIWFSGGRIDRRRGFVTDSDLGRDPAALVAAPALIPTEFVSGAAPLMTRRTWNKIGGFDARLFLYWEDVDLCLRATSLGLKMAVVRDARIVHLEGRSSKGKPRGRAMAYFYMARNRVLVCRSSGTRGFSLVFGAGAIALARLIAYSFLRDGRGRAARLRSITAGTYRGLRGEI